MNQNTVRVVVATLMGLIGAAMMFSAIASGGNVIGEVAQYGMAICFLVGLLSPKGGVILMLVLAGYSDLLKRLMVLETRITLLDLTFVLGMAPMALAGVVVACILRKFFIEGITRWDIGTFGVAFVFLLLGAAMGFRGEGGMRALRVVADYGAFSFLLFVLPILYPSREKLLGLLKVALVFFVPVAIYGIWQRVFGLADFEHAYLLTGMSIESRQLGDVEVRPFSTLNAASSLTMVMAACVMVTLAMRHERKLGALATWLLVGLFSVACFMTFTRTGWLALVAALLLIPILRFKITTFAMYAAGIGGFVLLVWQSDFFLNNLHYWQDQIYGSSATDDELQGLRIVTLSDRFIGFENMKRPENWQPFGIEGQGGALAGKSSRYSTTFSHDAISGFLFQFGYVPFFGLILAALGGLYVTHKEIFRMDAERKRFAQLVLAGVFGLLASLLTGRYVFQFPANIFLWSLVSLVVITIMEQRRVRRMRRFTESSEAARVPAPSADPQRLGRVASG